MRIDRHTAPAHLIALIRTKTNLKDPKQYYCP